MADRVLLIRHGETDDNVIETAAQPLSRAAFAQFIARCNDARLTSRGREQARDVGRKLASTQLDCLYVSPLTRARDTAAIITSEGIPHAPIVIDELRELVPLSGARFHDAREQLIPLRRQLWPAYARMLLSPWSPDRVDRSFVRLRKAWQRIANERNGGTAAVVGHGWATILIIRMLQVDPRWKVVRVDLSSCGISEVVRRR
jgi:broad specificity phosphatase PhoE